MGRNKALLVVDGNCLWRRQYGLLAQAGAAVRCVSVRFDDDWLPPDIPQVCDAGTQGPLGGLLAALNASSCSHVIALAVDLPCLPAEWFWQLRALCDVGRGAVGWNPEDKAYEPLASIYPRELSTVAREAIDRGEFSFQSLIARAVADGLLVVQTIAPEQRSWFANWNSPSDVVEN